MFPVITSQLGGHRFQFAAEKHIQKCCLDNVISMVSQSNFVRANLLSEPVQCPSTQTGTQPTGGFTFGDHLAYGSIGSYIIEKKGQSVDADNNALELWYQYQVTDAISVKPAVFWTNNYTSDADDTFGALVQTTFKF